MTSTQNSGFYGNDTETFYVSDAGRVYVLQSPDLVGVGEYREIDTLPSGAVAVTPDEGLSETASKIDAAPDLDAPTLDDFRYAARVAACAQVEIDIDLVSLDEMARGRHDQGIVLDAIALAAGYEVGALHGLDEHVRDAVVESYTLAYAERVSDHQRAEAADEA